MNAVASSLRPDDIIEIKYRAWRNRAGEADLVDLWVRGQIMDAPADARPLARLADGQITEIPSYMTWRIVARASTRSERAHAKAPANDAGTHRSRAA